MIEHRVSFTDEELVAEAVQHNLPILALNRFLRSLPENQRGFFKECRIVAVIPVYMPRGDFKENVHAMNMDKDQLDWLLTRHPEFKASDDTANNTLATGSRIVSCGVDAEKVTGAVGMEATCNRTTL